MRRLVVRVVMQGVVWVGGGGCRCDVWGLVMGVSLGGGRRGRLAMVCVGGG